MASLSQDGINPPDPRKEFLAPRRQGAKTGLEMNPNVCTPLTPVRVPAGRGRFGKSMLRLRTEATSASNRRVRDIDALTLICRPAP